MSLNRELAHLFAILEQSRGRPRSRPEKTPNPTGSDGARRLVKERQPYCQATPHFVSWDERALFIENAHPYLPSTSLIKSRDAP